MQIDHFIPAGTRSADKTRRNLRGVYEKVPGSNVWWIRYVDAQSRYRREKAGTKSAAIDLYRKRKTEALQGKKLPERLRRTTVSFVEIARDALEYSRTTKVPEAYRIDRWHMQTLLTWFRERAAEEITPLDIERRLAQLAETGRKPATVNRYRTLLSLTFSLAVRNGKLAANPVRLVKRRKENNVRVRFLDEREESAIRQKIRELHPDREPDFDLALHTGMRRGEQFRLCWHDVDLKRGILTIGISKTGEARYIHLNSVARAALLKLRQRCDSEGYVCPGPEGVRSKDKQRWFEESVLRCGVRNFRWHDLRHTFASRLVMKGVPLRSVQTLLGHKRIETTLRYTHLGEAHLLEAVERLTEEPTDTNTDTSHNGAVENQMQISA
jgi:integrase